MNKLKLKQDVALTLVSLHSTQGQIEETMGIAKNTICRWKKDYPDFKRRWEERLAELAEQAREQLQLSNMIVNTELLDIISNSERDTDRLAAIKLYYDVMQKQPGQVNVNLSLEIGD